MRGSIAPRVSSVGDQADRAIARELKYALAVRRHLPVLALIPALAAAAEVETNRTAQVIVSQAGPSPARGPRDALVTIEFFCNFAHPGCTQIARLLHDVWDR